MTATVSLKACACTDERSYHFIRTDLGVEGAGRKLLDEVKSAIGNATNSATNATSTKKLPPARARIRLPATVTSGAPCNQRLPPKFSNP